MICYSFVRLVTLAETQTRTACHLVDRFAIAVANACLRRFSGRRQLEGPNGSARPAAATSTIFRGRRRHLVAPATLRRGRLAITAGYGWARNMNRMTGASRRADIMRPLNCPQRRSDRSLRRQAGVSMTQTNRALELAAGNQTTANGPAEVPHAVA